MSAPDWRTESEIAAFNEGKAAYEDGYADDLNPYQPGTHLFEQWFTGWDAGYELHWREREMNERDKILDARR